MTSTNEPNPQVVSKWSWPMWADKIHGWFMHNMGLWHSPEQRFQKGTKVLVDPNLLEIVFLGLALPGEVGEMCNDIKKIWRDGRSDYLVEKLSKEVADVRIYLYHIEKWLGGDSNETTAAKIRELMERWPGIAKDIGYVD